MSGWAERGLRRRRRKRQADRWRSGGWRRIYGWRRGRLRSRRPAERRLEVVGGAAELWRADRRRLQYRGWRRLLETPGCGRWKGVVGVEGNGRRGRGHRRSEGREWAVAGNMGRGLWRHGERRGGWGEDGGAEAGEGEGRTRLRGRRRLRVGVGWKARGGEVGYQGSPVGLGGKLVEGGVGRRLGVEQGFWGRRRGGRGFGRGGGGVVGRGWRRGVE
ncbi:hypothetical protein KP509_37G030100 [Ceratopteris richardii]|uniref:Uncharacterized protein n=1 Tax=Ceratopteris richardii TaxID=49495 RepID=A0A8T2Q7Z2_CERRI|nr:hypothetical protein KP509_37G030100 [Ceratopteris richardii]